MKYPKFQMLQPNTPLTHSFSFFCLRVFFLNLPTVSDLTLNCTPFFLLCLLIIILIYRVFLTWILRILIKKNVVARNYKRMQKKNYKQPNFIYCNKKNSPAFLISKSMSLFNICLIYIYILNYHILLQINIILPIPQSMTCFLTPPTNSL